MIAFIPSAGLGTRLRPWTLSHPKALVPVGGVPMLERVILSLKDQGFDRFVVNVHHFADQIVAFLDSHDFGVEIMISDETAQLLDTGGALLHARRLLESDGGPILVHNVDILTDLPVGRIMEEHLASGADDTLVVSNRQSNRRLVFDSRGLLKGWHSLADDSRKPAGYVPASDDVELAFSGIHVMSPSMFDEMERQHRSGAFSVIDFLLEAAANPTLNLRASRHDDMRLLDIGKPDTLCKAEDLLTINKLPR